MEENWPMRKCTLPETGPVNIGERNIRAGQYLKGTKLRKTDSRRRIQVFGRRMKVRGSEVHDDVVPGGQPNCAARPVVRSVWSLLNDSTWLTIRPGVLTEWFLAVWHVSEDCCIQEDAK